MSQTENWFSAKGVGDHAVDGFRKQKISVGTVVLTLVVRACARRNFHWKHGEFWISTLPRKPLPTDDTASKILKSIFWQGFGEHVRQLMLGGYFFNDYLLRGDTLPEMMQLY